MAEQTQSHPKSRPFRRFCVCSAVVLLVVAVAVIVVNLTVAKLPAMPPADGSYISLHGKKIHYVEQAGPGTPIVMLHGLPGTHDDFDPVVKQLQGVHVLALDRPGFGWSDGGWLPFQEQVDVVHELITQRKLAPAVVVGHSFGGTLALALARRYPQDISRLVLIAPGAGGMRSSAGDDLQARYLLFSHLPVVKSVIGYTFGNIALRLSAHFGAENAFAPAPVDRTYMERLIAVTLTPGNTESYARDQLQFNATSAWLDDNVPQIHVPSVMIAALGDRLVSIQHARRLSHTLPGNRLVTVDGNHMIPYTHPDVVAACVRDAHCG